MKRTNEQIKGLVEDDENFLLCPHCCIYVSVKGKGKCPLCGAIYKNGEWTLEGEKKKPKEKSKEDDDPFSGIYYPGVKE